MTPLNRKQKSSLARKIRFLRDGKHETREDLAKSVNVSPETVKKYEEGTGGFSEDVIVHMANHYGFDNFDCVPDPLEDAELLEKLSRDNRISFASNCIRAFCQVFFDTSWDLSDGLLEAIENHRNFMSNIDHAFSLENLNEAIKAYRQAEITEHDKYAVDANVLSLVILRETTLIERSLMSASTPSGLADLNTAELLILSTHMLKQHSLLPQEAQKYIENVADQLCDNSLTTFSKIGHYFTALRLLLGIETVAESASENQRIGLHAMLGLVMANNEYACEFFSVLFEIEQEIS